MEKIELPIEKNNISPSNPDFKWLYKMLSILIPILVICYLIFYIFAYIIIGNLSLEDEKKYLGNIGLSDIDTNIYNIDSLKNKIPNIKNYNIYLQNTDEVNAYTLLGGNIIITKGLLENIHYEEELIFILGHEIRHIENRDILNSLLTEIPFTITLQYLGFDIGNNVIDLSSITNKYISKNTELHADEGGIDLINNMKLNLECSLNFFEKNNTIFSNYLQLVSTHPRNIKRINNIKSKNINGKKECSEFQL